MKKECPICLERKTLFDRPGFWQRAPCNHMFCVLCLMKIAFRDAMCPLCRHEWTCYSALLREFVIDNSETQKTFEHDWIEIVTSLIRRTPAPALK